MSSAETKGTRVLACALCKQRRIKCSRSFPCTTCMRAGVQCVQPALKKRRRRRVHQCRETELLLHLRGYEDILRQHSISFKPYLTSGADDFLLAKDKREESSEVLEEKYSRSTRQILRSIKRVAIHDLEDEGEISDSSDSCYGPPDDGVKSTIQAADHLLFGAPDPGLYLPSLHPEQAHIFRLWHLYLDNVNPLLKVTHTPTLQPRIIQAASDVYNIDGSLQALMFSIYCVAVHSLSDEECLAIFGTLREELLVRYQIACKETLLQCSPWRSTELDTLLALYLYLVSLATQVESRSLACMIASAIRIAQRMGIDSEALQKGTKLSTSDVEMRRRLWWSLVMYDHRVCEMVSQERSTSLSPSWDCYLPSGINDFEMQMEMPNASPEPGQIITEALFCVVRSELADWVRHQGHHVSAPSLRPSVLKRSCMTLDEFDRAITDRYLRHCNPQVSLHFITLWTTRGFFSRCRLREHHMARASNPAELQTDSERNNAHKYAIEMLECDIELRNSRLVSGFLWLVESLYSPILAHFDLFIWLAKRPSDVLADKAWNTLCLHFEALNNGPKHHRTRIMLMVKFSNLVLQAWDARQAWRKSQNHHLEQMPPFVAEAAYQKAQGRDVEPVQKTGISSIGETLNSHGNFTPNGVSDDSGITTYPASATSFLSPEDTETSTLWSALETELNTAQEGLDFGGLGAH